MASLQKDPSGNYHLAFKFGGRRFKRSLKTKNPRKANAACARVEENISLIESGRMELAANVDLPTYLLSNGNLDSRPRVSSALRVGQLFAAYQECVPADSMERSSLFTANLHMNHWIRILGAMQPLQSLAARDVQRYVTQRSKELGRRENVSATTIRKEVATFRALWNWAVSQELLSGIFPAKGIVYPKQSQKPAFQTRTQIERRIAQEQLVGTDASELWNCLYLSKSELDQVLESCGRSRRMLTFIRCAFSPLLPELVAARSADRGWLTSTSTRERSSFKNANDPGPNEPLASFPFPRDSSK